MFINHLTPFIFELPENATTNSSGQVVANLSGAGAPGTTKQDVLWDISASGAFDSAQGNTALADATGGAITITLPAGSDAILGIRHSFIKTDVSSNLVQFQRTGSDTIEGVSVVGSDTRHGRIDLMWAGDMWRRCTSVLSPSNFLTTFGNLAGVTSPKLSRQAIGSNDHIVFGDLASVKATDAEVSYRYWPFSIAYGNAFATEFGAVITGATDADVILTLAMNGVPATPSLTIPAGAAGARGIVTLTLDNGIPAEGYFTVSVTGANTNAVGASYSIRAII